MIYTQKIWQYPYGDCKPYIVRKADNKWLEILFVCSSWILFLISLNLYCFWWKVFSSHIFQFIKLLNAGQYTEFGLPTIISSGKIDQVTSSRVHNTHFTLDIRSIIQSSTVCVPVDCNAVFHLLHHRNASKIVNTIIYFSNTHISNFIRLLFRFFFAGFWPNKAWFGYRN